ncbi:preprotein translocase, SecY subunit [Catenulispora acidiphila DSM 44928]|uniref:Protein translocase subunit SecY n=1 Tax=Catenulispora acidiphila (strain DSM 44928 / JCM 14897 / NBRC 102108 / NRRL B-24433 / ID139908) TaxID=479433 RepID=C7Q423_CATAD|nr:preprotein translocase subunit SecY [Catenulispora acidiphila]ACU69883.1 preprotein translocase, SecY subunit [Catenulispora acidiphila DSM 44928]
MLTAFARAFRTPDLRKKLLFTLGIMALFRLGAHIPAPGVDTKALSACVGISKASGQGNGALGLINLFSGGALLQLSIFALGIMPYITASIILQLLTVVIPRLEALKKEGQAGQTKITQYTRYLTIGLAILQSTTMLTLMKNNPSALLGPGCSGTNVIFQKVDWIGMAVMVITLTAGTTLIMWLGELITDRGIGNGMSLLIFTSITANFPSSLWSIKQGSTTMDGWPVFFGVLLMGMLLVGLVVFVEQGQRRIPVQYAKRMVGRRMYGGSSTYIPMKVNQAGVIPVIFASSLLQLPLMVANFTNPNATKGWAHWVNREFGMTTNGYSLAYSVTYFLLILGFAFFYVSITFVPDEIADNMKKYGGFIPGIRAGKPTAEYLQYVSTRVTWPGALYLAVIAIIPMIALAEFHASGKFPFGGTTILIMVGVGLETVKQIESQLQQHNYEGFLR